MKKFRIFRESKKFELVGIIEIKDIIPLINESRSMPGSLICFDGNYEPFHLLVDTMNKCLPEGREFHVSHGCGYSWIHSSYDTKWEIDGEIMGIYLQTADEKWFVE